MNYLKINGKKIELTNEQVEELKRSFELDNSILLSSVAPGDTFKIGKYEFIVLEHSKETTAVIAKDCLKNSVTFGKDNNFVGSNVYDVCKTFAKEIEQIVGKNNLVTHTVDLTADDGLKDYGKTNCEVSLLTANLYRRYVDILDKYKLNKWWWLATAYSTPTHGYTYSVKCVSPSGNIYYCSNYYNLGVRPFLRFVSSIYVSCED